MPVPLIIGGVIFLGGGFLLRDQIVKKVKGKKIAILGQRATGKTTLLKFWGCTR
ncbi:hypothetical protein [Acinetobacter ursingii]|uniref:hypothetical protein n=1 Tax=Acinetobacter ursingii TaxID=108980 RepID=UPI00300A2A05